MYAYSQAAALAGQIGKGNLATAKTSSEHVATATAVKAGLFVAISATGGIKSLAANTDVLAGVVMRSVMKDEWNKDELLDVMHITAGDAIWVSIAEGEAMARGDLVHVVAVANGAKVAGSIQKAKDGTNTIATNYCVIAVNGTLALITKL